MRRYIIAILAILCLCSCKLEQGSKPNPKRAGRLMYEQVTKSTSDIVHYYPYILYTDAIMCGNITEAQMIQNNALSHLIISIEPGVVIFNSSDNTFAYKVITDGKTLAEGGEWQLIYDSKNQRSFTYSYTGIEGGNHAFKYNIVRGNTTVNFVVTPALTEYSANVYISGNGVIRTDTYEVVFKVQEDAPLYYRPDLRNPQRGVLDMTYTNYETNTIRHATYDIEKDYYIYGYYDL